MALHTFSAAGLRWLDLRRDETDGEKRIEAELGFRPHDRHLSDLRNVAHPPYFDGTDEYDLLVMRVLDSVTPPEEPQTRAIAFLITNDALVTVRAPEDDTFDPVLAQCARGEASPESIGELVYLLLDSIAERLLDLRDPLTEKLNVWQERLLDPMDPFNDWQVLMRVRSRMRWLGGRMAMQREAVDQWRANTVLTLSPDVAIRLNDIDEHIARVEHHVGVIQGDIDSLVQVHFAASSQKTNQIMQLLAVLSAVFLPLNLMAGIFGMNFVDMPLLHLAWGGTVTILLMISVAGGLLWWFRKRRWF
ncbi:MAG: magnesium transporter CorA family protein [Gammaproteobacteria bacterium]|nr:magnesium transporter CorA family protein [Gammaproteobacteria bacterium]MCP5136759.1 magnesium transporter CorA family protein [Gammaproteobacteria bacterium]